MLDPPMCYNCKHQFRERRKCEAFPAGIPEPIYNGEFDHRKPFEGDRGIRYEPIDPNLDVLTGPPPPEGILV